VSDDIQTCLVKLSETLGEEEKAQRVAIALPESLGDCVMLTSLLRDFRECYPNDVLYIFTKPVFMPVFEGNLYINHVLPWQEFMDNVMLMEHYFFRIFMCAHVMNQRFINYLKADSTKIDYRYKEGA
jgi:hypothetical protein